MGGAAAPPYQIKTPREKFAGRFFIFGMEIISTRL
jgi:hypothetical protein